MSPAFCQMKAAFCFVYFPIAYDTGRSYDIQDSKEKTANVSTQAVDFKKYIPPLFSTKRSRPFDLGEKPSPLMEALGGLK